MALDKETMEHLVRIRDEIEEILAEIGDIVPPEFRTTVVLRYCGTDDEVKELFENDPAVWTDDVSYDIEKEIARHRKVREEAA